MTNVNLMGYTTLQHHGVKGMKWGIRKKIKKASQKRKRRKKLEKQSRKTANDWAYKYADRSKMSTDDLRKSVDRLRLENEFAKQVGISNQNVPKTGYRKLMDRTNKIVDDTKAINSLTKNVLGTGRNVEGTVKYGRQTVNLANVAYRTARAAAGL